jgi:hypothetical protein
MNQLKLFRRPLTWGDGRINQLKFFWRARDEGRRLHEPVQVLSACL